MQVSQMETNKFYGVFSEKEAVRSPLPKGAVCRGSVWAREVRSHSLLSALGSRWTAGVGNVREKGTTSILWVHEEPQGHLGKGDGSQLREDGSDGGMATAGTIGLQPRNAQCTSLWWDPTVVTAQTPTQPASPGSPRAMGWPAGSFSGLPLTKPHGWGPPQQD